MVPSSQTEVSYPRGWTHFWPFLFSSFPSHHLFFLVVAFLVSLQGGHGMTHTKSTAVLDSEKKAMSEVSEPEMNVCG